MRLRAAAARLRCRRYFCPHRGALVVMICAPVTRQAIHDSQATAIRGGLAEPAELGLGGAAAVLDADPDRAVLELPAHPDQRSWQRLGVPERVAEQLADDDRRIADRGLEDPRCHQVRYQVTPGDPSAGGRKR